MFKRARFSSSKLGGLAAALLAAVVTLVVWNGSLDENTSLLPHYVKIMDLMLILMAGIAVMAAAIATAHRFIIDRRMRALSHHRA